MTAWVTGGRVRHSTSLISGNGRGSAGTTGRHGCSPCNHFHFYA
ncbi:hypothetical protein PCL1606_19400 [Pseudomonas chlororaphis]|uniref:Uncharacterized protein n=1 Tax=Pseudomonas chlororaphis TaxID=587753 RepID=A0A0D5XWC8_9PSED|nr:hypothetical protein PCL1606_19400 [Pseudomonas chlororaphis]